MKFWRDCRGSVRPHPGELVAATMVMAITKMVKMKLIVTLIMTTVMKTMKTTTTTVMAMRMTVKTIFG